MADSTKEQINKIKKESKKKNVEIQDFHWNSYIIGIIYQLWLNSHCCDIKTFYPFIHDYFLAPHLFSYSLMAFNNGNIFFLKFMHLSARYFLFAMTHQNFWKLHLFIICCSCIEMKLALDICHVIVNFAKSSISYFSVYSCGLSM